MKSPIEIQKRKLENVLNNIRDIMREEAIIHREFIAELNRSQLRQGEKEDGESMPDYVEGSNQPSAPGAITLFDEGDFHSSLDALFSDEGFQVVSSDDKAEFLISKFGNILGLNNENKLLLRARMLPGLRIRVNSLI
jgi:hypothetical protein